ncbi:hypothetical protein [Pseudomonas sp. MPC6]|uniref:IS66 family insertion sequence element accessory protein TnpA n=1 Tax=unclassified Pseudomonas TaxID=196821 RepID=UPI00110FFA02|nr:hypothetical protein [Pseudomonas sp. MPC6]QCY09600.1 hypothetical protein ELQ88_01905 [Pseudomonas sp. MPC6]
MKTLSPRREFWAEHIQTWRTSGLTQVAYCEQHNLKPKSFGYWFRRRESATETMTLVPVSLRGPQVTTDLLLRHSSGWELALSSTVEPAWLAQLLREMV